MISVVSLSESLHYDSELSGHPITKTTKEDDTVTLTATLATAISNEKHQWLQPPSSPSPKVTVETRDNVLPVRPSLEVRSPKPLLSPLRSSVPPSPENNMRRSNSSKKKSSRGSFKKIASMMFGKKKKKQQHSMMDMNMISVE